VPEVRSASLRAQAKGISAEDLVAKSTASMSEQDAPSGRQNSYADVGAAYTRVVAGRPVKRADTEVDPWLPLPTKNGTSREGKEGMNEKTSLCWRILRRLSHCGKEAKLDAQAYSQGYQHCVGTRCFDGRSSKMHLSRDT
jgi:hypothetical protein